MKVTREAHVAACTSSKETETETLHSATEAEKREDTGIKDHAVAEQPRESCSESADRVVVNYRSGAGQATTP